jgi:molecular chaperone GrpE
VERENSDKSLDSAVDGSEIDDIEISAAQSGDEKEEKPAEAEYSESDYLNQLQRVQAEFINYKKRIEQQRSEWQHLVTREILYQLLPILDDYDLFFKHENQSQAESRDGIKMIYDKMLSILTEMGLEVLSADNAEFDPELHEAVHVEKSTETPHGQILDVWQKGYQFRGKLLRPAKVIVADGDVVKETDER